MRNLAEYSCTASDVRHATRPLAALAAAATVVGVSLSIAASEAVGAPAATGSETVSVNAAVTDLDLNTPSLHVGVKTSGPQPIAALTVALPSGLSFSRDAADIAHGVRTTGADKPHSTVRNGLLTVALKGNSTNVSLAILGSALTESKGLEKSVATLLAFNRTHPSDERVLPFTVTVTVTTAAHGTAKVPVTISYE